MAIIHNDELTRIVWFVYLCYNSIIEDISYFNVEDIYLVDDMINDTKNITGISVEALGGVLIPNRTNGKFYLVIDVNDITIENLIESVLHELTHIADYTKYIEYFSSREACKKIRKLPYFEAQYFYSECHAFYIGGLYAPKIYDWLLGAEQEKIHIQTFEEQMVKYIKGLSKKEKRDCYRLARLMGTCLISDIYQNTPDMANSCIHRYIPMIYGKRRQKCVLRIFRKVRDSIYNNHAMHNLHKIAKHLSSLKKKKQH